MMQDCILQDHELAQEALELESKMLMGRLTPRVAAQELLDGVFSRLKQQKS